jgi:perosamine synthetase
MRYPIYTPDIAPYTSSIQKAISDGWISSQGEFIPKAERVCSKLLGSPYVVLVNNGTSATHLLYKAIKFKHPHIDRIYVPDYVFVAVWNCALYEYKPDQISVLKMDSNTLNMCVDEEYICSLERNSAVMVVHNVGNVVNVPRLQRLRPDLVFVEDCCEAFLETYEGSAVGTKSLCAAVSFFGNKLITTGEGGLWYTNDKELYDFIFKSCHHGTTSERYVYDILGYNYRMTNLQAAFLYDQIQDIASILKRKRDVYNRYARMLLDTEYIPATSGLWMFILRSKNEPYSSIQARMNICGIDTRPMFYDIHKHTHLLSIDANTQDIGHSSLCMIPSSPRLSTFDQASIVQCITHIKNFDIRQATLPHLQDFLHNPIPPTFRYYETRSPVTCLVTHQLTVLLYDENIPVAYGHLDDSWIGICVLPSSQRKGYGSYILDFLILYAKANGNVYTRLTVDLENEAAIQLYKKKEFYTAETTEKYHLMQRELHQQ